MPTDPGEIFNYFLEPLMAICVYGLAFFALSKILEDPSKKPKDKQYLTRTHPKSAFIHEDFYLELKYFLFNNFVNRILVKLAILTLTIYVLVPFIPFQIFAEEIQALPYYVQLLIGLFIADAAFFFPHWFQHRFLWPFHSIHHSAKELHWITALRLHPIDDLSFNIGGALALYIFGFQGESILIAIMIHEGYNTFVHANINLEFPKPFCYILGSPNYHRWHHAANKEAIDKNLATMFPVFDLIFGSYYHPPGKLPKAYGIYNERETKQKMPASFAKQLLFPFKSKK